MENFAGVLEKVLFYRFGKIYLIKKRACYIQKSNKTRKTNSKINLRKTQLVYTKFDEVWAKKNKFI